MLQRLHQYYLRALIQLTTTVPWLTVLIAWTLAGVALWYTVSKLEFESSRNALVASQTDSVDMRRTLKKEFKKIDYLVVVIEPPSLERGKQFVDALVPRLLADIRHIQHVIARADTSGLAGKKLLYLSPNDLFVLKERLQHAQNFITDSAKAPGLLQLLTSVNQEIRKTLVSHITKALLRPPTSIDSTNSSSRDVSFLSQLFSGMAQAIDKPEAYRFRSPWGDFFLEDGAAFSNEVYLTSKHDRFLFVLVDDRGTKGGFVKHAASLRALRAHLQTLQQDFPDVQVGVTGEQALSTDEMLAAQRDMLLATAIALVGVAVLFIVAFLQIGRPLLVVATLVIGVGWTLGWATLTVGHLNILSVAFIPTLIGLGIDFGIHLVARYGEERTQQVDFDTAIQVAYLHTGPGVIVAGLTTAAAFYGVTLTDFRGLVELGLIAGSGMLLCLLASFTVLPALLAIYERHRRVVSGVWQPWQRDPLHILQRHPRRLLGAIVLATVAGVLFLPLPRFDYNLLNLQAHGTESVDWEYRLFEESGRSSWYALSVADSLEELRRKKDRFAALPVVDRVASIASLIPEDQDLRRLLVKMLASYVPKVKEDWQLSQPPIDLNAMALTLHKMQFNLQGPDHFGKAFPMLQAIHFRRRLRGDKRDASTRDEEDKLTETRNALLNLQERLRTTPPEAVQRALVAFQHDLMNDFFDKLAFLRRNLNPTPITLSDVPDSLRRRFVSKNGQYLLQIFPRHNIWEREAMQAFVTQLQAIDPDMTGSPVIAWHAIQQMHRGYIYGGIYALLAIVGIVFLLFRRLWPTFLALLPMLFGGLWTIIGMALFDLQLNMANSIIVPLFIGIAVDDGIHLVHRRLEDPKCTAASLTHSTSKAIVLTSLTSMVGFGSLMVARHSGVFSLGLLTTISIGCSLVATLIILPLMLDLDRRSMI